MERVSKERLIEILEKYQSYPRFSMNLHIISAITEILERREFDTECPFCGEFHDKRVACTVPDMKA